MIMHFNTQKERLAYVKGEFEEVKPIEADSVKKEQSKAENNEKPSKSASKSKKRAKKDKKNDAVQAK